ncbi:UNVERIFIED_CONTAM: Phospholipase SGR2, partial [Sesamum indicum]
VKVLTICESRRADSWDASIKAVSDRSHFVCFISCEAGSLPFNNLIDCFLEFIAKFLAVESEDTKEKGEKSYGALMLDRLIGNEGGRIDHVLQVCALSFGLYTGATIDKTFRHPYISAIGAHTNYWRDSDTALFMLKHLYRDIPEEPILASDQVEDSSKDENGLTGWFDQREVADEELPLTFADSFISVSPNNVKRMMKN